MGTFSTMNAKKKKKVEAVVCFLRDPRKSTEKLSSLTQIGDCFGQNDLAANRL